MHKHSRLAVAVVGSLAAVTLSLGHWWEPRRLTFRRVEIVQGRLAEALAGRTAALLSDLHFDHDGGQAADKALQRLMELRPDLILLAGDFVAWGAGEESYNRAFSYLARLEAPLGVYAVLGDADRTDSRRSCEFCHREGTGEPTTRHGVVFLRDAERVVQTNRGEFRIVGVDLASRHLPSGTSSGTHHDDSPAIVLAHTSLVFHDIDPRRETLVLAGDTHGGQIRLPNWLWRLSGLKPDPEHLYGLYSEGRKTLFVTRGIGTSKVPFRLGAPPEIVLFSFGNRQ